MNVEDEIKKIDKKIAITGIIDTPGVIMIGLALHAKFSANGKPMLDILNNPDVINIFFVLGGLIMVWGGYRVVTLTREKVRLVSAKSV